LHISTSPSTRAFIEETSNVYKTGQIHYELKRGQESDEVNGSDLGGSDSGKAITRGACGSGVDWSSLMVVKKI
jgi:hypothetical protein